MSTSAVPQPVDEPQGEIRAGGYADTYRRYVLGTMACVYGLNLVDRGVIQLLLQPIKQDLQLSDTQLGFLTGIAFGLFYATMGVPIARWADRGNRVTITSLAIALWGLTVMACLFVTGFVSMLFARIAAAVGEAGCKPPTYSLVGDYFPKPDERTRAMAIYWIGGPIASLFSYMVGGWLNELYGWRLTFFIIGIPGLILALIVKLTIKEPRLEVENIGPRRPLPPMRLVISTLWGQPSLRHLTIALTLLYTMNFGLNPWYAAFMIRSHGMSTGELGTVLGLIFGLSGIVGVLCGGYISTRWFSGNERGQMRMTAIAMFATLPAFLAFLLLPGRYQALASLALVMVILNFFFAPTYSLLQRLVADASRATTLAVVLLLTNLIGMGIGPQIVGMLSDRFAPDLGSDSLRWAMVCMAFVAPWSAVHFWLVGRTAQADLEAPAQDSPADGGMAAAAPSGAGG